MAQDEGQGQGQGQATEEKPRGGWYKGRPVLPEGWYYLDKVARSRLGISPGYAREQAADGVIVSRILTRWVLVGPRSWRVIDEEGIADYLLKRFGRVGAKAACGGRRRPVKSVVLS